MDNRKTIKINADTYDKLNAYCNNANMSMSDAVNLSVNLLLKSGKEFEVWVPNECDGYPKTVDDLKKIARQANIIVDDKTLEEYLTDRTRKSWIPNGSRYRLRISAIGPDIKYWVYRGKQNNTRKDYQSGSNIRNFDEHNRTTEANTDDF